MASEPREVHAKLDELARSVAALERRLEAIEERLRIVEPAQSSEELEGAVESAGADVLDLGGGAALLGRTLLVLGGGYLIRALTEAQALPRATGVVLGLAYALLFLVLASRAAAKGRRPSAGFHAAGAALVAYPLVWEGTTRFEILDPVLAAVVLAVITGALFVVAWHRRLGAAAWIGVAGAAGAGLGLQVSTGALEPPAVLLLLVGAAVLGLGRIHSWAGLEASSGVVAVFAALVVGTGALSRGSETHRGVALATLLALFVLYVASFLIATLRGERRPGAFEIVQSLLVTVVGLGGATRVATEIGGAMVTGLGIATLAAGVGVYALVLLHARLREAAVIFHLWATLAWVLCVVGVRTVVEPPGVGLSLFALSAAILATRRAGSALRLHATASLVLAALLDSLLGQTLDALVVPHDGGSLLPFTLVHGCIVAAAAVAALLPAAGDRARENAWLRHTTNALIVLVLLGMGGLAVHALAPLVTLDGAVDPARLALCRTGVLTGLTLLIAAASRTAPLRPAASLVYPLLVVTGLKLLVEDFFLERPRHLVIALALYATSLIVAPRIRAVRTPANESTTPSPSPR